MSQHSAKKSALLLAFLAFTPVCSGAFAQTVTGGDPVPGPYRPSSTVTGGDPVPGPYRPSSSNASVSSTSSMTALLMDVLLAL